MVVAERGGHLAGTEVEVGAALGVVDGAALSPGDDGAVLEPRHVGSSASPDDPAVKDALDFRLPHRSVPRTPPARRQCMAPARLSTEPPPLGVDKIVCPHLML